MQLLVVTTDLFPKLLVLVVNAPKHMVALPGKLSPTKRLKVRVLPWFLNVPVIYRMSQLMLGRLLEENWYSM